MSHFFLLGFISVVGLAGLKCFQELEVIGLGDEMSWLTSDSSEGSGTIIVVYCLLIVGAFVLLL